MKFGLDENSIEEIRSVFSRFPEVEKVLIYGSRAMGNFRPGSDIDIAIVGAQLTQKDIRKIAAELEKMEMLYSFDVLLYAELKDAGLKNHIDRIGQEIYRTEIEQN